MHALIRDPVNDPEDSRMTAENTLHDSDVQPPWTGTKTPEKPGPLRGQVWLTLQTHQAQQLVRGRNRSVDKSPIIGLVGFADRLRLIWQAARDDDPYADWWLLKVQEATEEAGHLIQDRQQVLDALLHQVEALRIKIAESRKPYRLQLQFANPYAYRGANLLSAYDKLVCMALTTQHVGLLAPASCRQAHNDCARKLRALFTLPQGYRFLGLDREGVRQDAAQAKQAHQLMGQVPDEVLNGEHLALWIPHKVLAPKDFTHKMGLFSPTTGTSPRMPAGQNDIS